MLAAWNGAEGIICNEEMFSTLLWRRLQGYVICKHSLTSALKICALCCIHIISQLKKKKRYGPKVKS